ncbi:helix-turn-helix domain-containing protein [Vallicoccus soli]|uniref:XRE family transcriptional regulator n=1 Tax=Vallicoccus soli TaxID=2339232 RepID=A0A3A3YWL4_9ACTN|nr:helix-turn-helix transcriptional regulator [Vallicoccus soli]RJK95947.1 XRE family transcriptional regulator [Vallicoccus soli]
MDGTRRELADFLRRARAGVDPARAGLPADGRVRRVPGLRREEVALLAGVSTDYYTRLEQGRPVRPSTGVVDAVARALDLDAAGRAHLADLLGEGTTTRPTRAPEVQRVRPGLHQLLDALEGQPAMVLGRRTDVLAANRVARALLVDWDRMPARQRNYARWVLLSDEARALFADWDVQARAVVETLRLDTGRDPGDRAARDLVAELAAGSPEFRTWWQEHRVYQRTSGSKRFRHPVVGDLVLGYETLTLPGDPDQTLFVYTAEPGSASVQGLRTLASWGLPAADRTVLP